MTRRFAEGYGTLGWFKQEYDKVVEDPWGLTWRASQQLRYERTLGALQRIDAPITSALDVGCATGDFTYILSRRLPTLQSLLGVDWVDSAVQRARQRFPERHFEHGSLFSLGNKYRHQFDLAVCLEVMCYVEPDQRSKALRSLKATLRPGGYALFSAFISHPPHFSPEQLLALVGSEFDIMGTDILHLRLVSLFEKLGTKAQHLFPQLGRRRGSGSSVVRLGKLPYSGVMRVEKWSRALKRLTASHTIVLARAQA